MQAELFYWTIRKMEPKFSINLHCAYPCMAMKSTGVMLSNQAISLKSAVHILHLWLNPIVTNSEYNFTSHLLMSRDTRSCPTASPGTRLTFWTFFSFKAGVMNSNNVYCEQWSLIWHHLLRCSGLNSPFWCNNTDTGGIATTLKLAISVHLDN